MMTPNRIVKYFLFKLARYFCIANAISIFSMCATASAQEVTAPLTITSLTELSFGAFSVEHGGGSVVVDPRSGACLPLSGAVMLRNLCERGQFEIRGVPESQVMIEILPGSSTDATQLKNLTIYPEGIVKLGLDGKTRVQVGGELSVASTQNIRTVSLGYLVNVSYLQ